MRGVLLLLFAFIVSATSSGKETSCDAFGNYGCSLWFEGNRLNCTDPNKGEMPWVARPIRSADYSVRSGDGHPSGDLTTYTPGKYIFIYVRALKFGSKYRGLLLHAVDSKNVTVGSWRFNKYEETQFWSPPQCNQHVMHVSAELKPYGSRLVFMAPPAGTGPLTFRALVKEGVANTGFFYYPNMHGELVLQEGPTSQKVWYTAKSGSECTTTCAEAGKPFDKETTKDITASAFMLTAAQDVFCEGPMLATCSASAPALSDNSGICHVKAQSCPSSQDNEDLPSGSTRICACRTKPAPTAVPTVPAPTSNIVSAAPARASRSMLFSVFLSFAISSLHSTKAGLLMSAGLLLAFAPEVSAHNWLHTPARGRGQASTTSPCLGRKSSDLHAQVGPNQEVSFKWASGHSRNTYVVVLAGSDESWLAANDFETMVADYINSAPAENDTAQTARYQRYHGIEKGHLFDGEKYLYSGLVDPSQQIWKDLNHSRTPTKTLYKYKPEHIAGDKRVSYKNPKYDWIESAAMYKHQYHRPEDYDAILVDFPARKGSGHYIVHWRWSGYYDCVDVDVRSNQVSLIYGKDNGNFLWNKIDHCQYLQPKSIDTSCLEVLNTVEACKKAVPSWKISRGYRVGFNVVPTKNPASVYPAFLNDVNIPWLDGQCVNEDWTILNQEGTVTPAPINWAAWKTARKAGKCTSVYSWTSKSLQEAVGLCSSLTDCEGISWESKGSGAQPYSLNQGFFVGCSGSFGTDTNSSWASFSKVVTIPPAAPSTPLQVSFQPDREDKYPVKLATGWLPEQGRPFANQNGHKYGWNCAEGKQCSWCFNDKNNPTAQNTYIYISSDGGRVCNNGVPINWEIEVPNGVYKVTTMSNNNPTDGTVGVPHCTFENWRMSNSKNFGSPTPAYLTQQVEVFDGHLTLNVADGFCQLINTVTIEKVANAMPPSWLPSSANPVWQLALPDFQPIGVVSLDFDGKDQFDCRYWWLWRGDRCPSGRPLGDFNKTEEGAIVGVSNTSCTSGSAACPGVTCGRIFKAPFDDNAIHINCGGVIGKYVWVLQPGRARIPFAGSIYVNRAKPARLDKATGTEPDLRNGTYVCYGLTAREQTNTQPEFITTSDPEDPIFYSTCFSVERNITWLTTSQPPPPAKWRFGSSCLDCDSFHNNRLRSEDHFSRWNVAEEGKCFPCSSSSSSSSSPTEGSGSYVKEFSPAMCDDNSDDRNLACNEVPELKEVKTKCRRRLWPGGRAWDEDGGVRSPWSSYYSTRVTLEECKVLAARDPQCSDDKVMYYDTRYNQCYCYAKHTCCGRCTPVSWTGLKSDIYRYVGTGGSNGNPSCTGGLLSADKQTCCPSYCKDAQGKNICDVKWQCMDEKSLVGGGSCCSTTNNLAPLPSCKDAQPPCRM